MAKIKKSKPIEKVAKGDKLKVNGKSYDVDSHYVLIDHGGTKEMAIELFDPKSKEGEGDCQVRYFDDRVEDTVKFFMLEKEFMYEEVELKSLEW